MGFTLAQLAQFVAVAEERSCTRAAARRRVAQPRLSTRVRQLEERLGFRLLDRSPRGVSLTGEGERFFAGAQSLLGESAKLNATVAAIAGEANALLRIGAVAESFYVSERNQLLDAFRDAHPAIEVRLENHFDPELRRLIVRGELDAAFLSGRAPDRLEAICIREGQCELLMPSGHPLARLDSIPVAALAGQRVGVFPRDRNPTAWDDSVGRLQQSGAELVTLSETLRAALIAQARRNGMLVLTLSSFGDHDDAGDGVCVRPLDDAQARADFVLVRRPVRPGDQALNRFWRFARRFGTGTAATPRGQQPSEALGDQKPGR
ncbi:MAG: LysR family transcriptional regulator [Novosphingobium sp.]